MRFNDFTEVDTEVNFLKTIEEYETWLLEKDQVKENDQNNMSEFELELNSRGISSHKNYVQCLSQLDYIRMGCDECNFKDRCVYRHKGNYSKLKNL